MDGTIGQIEYAAEKVSEYTWAVVRKETVAINSEAGAKNDARIANRTLKHEAERECEEVLA